MKRALFAVLLLVLAETAYAEDSVTLWGNYYKERSTRVVEPIATVTKDLPNDAQAQATYLVDRDPGLARLHPKSLSRRESSPHAKPLQRSDLALLPARGDAHDRAAHLPLVRRHLEARRPHDRARADAADPRGAVGGRAGPL